MEILFNGEVYSIPDAVPMNSSPPPYMSPSPFGFGCAGNSQLQNQKTQNPADNESTNPEETRGFKISSNVAHAVQRRPVSVNEAGTAKVRKKRSRGSRKAPTMLLNTDTANFKALVQRFTGFPVTPFGYPSTNPTFSPHVGQQELQPISKPLFYKGVLDPNMNCVSHINSPSDSYGLQQYNTTTFLPSQFLHHNINISSPLNLFAKAAQRQSSNTTPLYDVRPINSASVFPTPSITLPSDRRSASLI